MKKALCVFSGGLDSILAAELIRGQGVDVLALFFETPFFTPEKAERSAAGIGLPFEVKDIFERHMDIVKEPKHGYGGNMNPCIDCHGLMFRVAGEMMEDYGADFVISGEVLGQRPMSQNKAAMTTIAIESGMRDLLLRPLSARLLPETLPEREGWVDRAALMDIQGRSRKRQMNLAETLGIRHYPSPAGGCLLTEEAFSRRLRDLLRSVGDPERREIELLKLGRHFRITPESKVVVGRNRRENDAIRALGAENDILLFTPAVPGPTGLITGEIHEQTLREAAAVTAAYSDASEGAAVEVMARSRIHGERLLTVPMRGKADFRRHMV